MTQGKAILVIDLGNSSTKGKVLYGKKDGKYREHTFDASNTFSPIISDDDIAPTDNYSEATSTLFRIETEGLTSYGFKDEVKGTYANGPYQVGEYGKIGIRPTTLHSKVTQAAVVLSCYNAYWHGLKGVAKLAGVSVKDVDVSWTVVALLPPQDIKTDSEKLEGILRSITKLDILFPECQKDINIDTVKVLPEGYCAFVGTVYENGMQIRPDYKYLLQKNIIVIDIGEGTSDFVVMSKNKLQNNTLKTVSYGGKNVRSRLKGLVGKGVKATDEEWKEALLTGELSQGATVRDICKEINIAKQEIASLIYTELSEHLEEGLIEPSSIYGILIVGGGVLEGDNPNIIPLSKFIMDNFNQFFPLAQLIELPKHTVKKIEDDTPVTVEETISPRYLNLYGASILAEAIAQQN